MGVDFLMEETQTVERSDVETLSEVRKPRMFKVIMHNDDYSPMDFVVEVLMRYFDHPKEEAERLMWHVHQEGQATCGVFTRDIAETKIHQVVEYARRQEHPLMCTMEPV